MKIFKLMGIVFSFIGIASIAGVIISSINANKFIKSSIVTKGEITDIIIRTSQDSDGNTMHKKYPVVKFQDRIGNNILFESSSSVPNGMGVGLPVEVRYIPDNPLKAKLSGSIMDLWGMPIFFGVFGVVFTGVGIPFFWLGIRDDIKEKRALSYSKEIEVKISAVIQNKSISLNGKNPFQIEAQWLNSDTNQLHLFKSKNIWFDPSSFLKEKVLVKADPKNLKNYWMDISFLPKKV